VAGALLVPVTVVVVWEVEERLIVVLVVEMDGVLATGAETVGILPVDMVLATTTPGVEPEPLAMTVEGPIEDVAEAFGTVAVEATEAAGLEPTGMVKAEGVVLMETTVVVATEVVVMVGRVMPPGRVDGTHSGPVRVT